MRLCICGHSLDTHGPDGCLADDPAADGTLCPCPVPGFQEALFDPDTVIS